MKSSVSSFWIGWLLIVLIINTAVGLSATFGIESYLWKWHQDDVAAAVWRETSLIDEVRAYPLKPYCVGLQQYTLKVSI
jgi:hypothetical protein